MTWQIKTIASKSSLSEAVFKLGDKVVCLIFKDEATGDLSRADILVHEVEAFKFPGLLLGRWNRVINTLDEEKVNDHDRVESAEGFFISLYHNAHHSDEEETNVLKYLLALMLERKRLLRPIGPSIEKGMQHYFHVKRKQEFEVPIVDISSDLMFKIQDTLDDLIL